MSSPEPAFRLAVKDDAVVLTFFNGGETIYTYDRSGRLFAAWVGQRFYRRTLDNRLMEKHTVVAEGIRTPVRRALPATERDTFLSAAAEVASQGERALARGGVELQWSAKTPPSFGEAVRLVAAAAAFDAGAAQQDAERYGRVYRPIGILPPDQYLGLVVQVTEGCHWNRCTFCTFYREAPFRVKPIPELEAHLAVVVEYFGDGLSLRRGLFLGEANALVLPTPDLLARLDLITQWFAHNGTRGRPIYSFLDIFTGRRKTVEEYAQLRTRGLRRVYLGVETGDEALLRFLNKPQQPVDAVELVRALKAAGLSVGVIVMAGVGGARFTDAHVARTLALLNSLPLAEGDLIYLSAFIEHPYSDYAAAARAYGIRSLTPPEIHEQVRAFRRGLRFTPDRGPRIARYDVDEFLY